MSGTKSGGAKAAATMKKKYGPSYYSIIGSDGGKKSNTGGWYGDSEAARAAGLKGVEARRKNRLPVEQPKTNIFRKLALALGR